MNYGMRDQSWRIFSSKKLVFQIWWTKALRLSHPTTSQGMCCILHINVVQTLSMHLWEIEWLAFEYFNGYTFYIYICMPSFTVEVYFEFKKGAKKCRKIAVLKYCAIDIHICLPLEEHWSFGSFSSLPSSIFDWILELSELLFRIISLMFLIWNTEKKPKTFP